MKEYVCIMPIRVGAKRIRENEIVDEETAKQAGDLMGKHFEAVNKRKAAPVTQEAPMTISDIAKSRQYNPSFGLGISGEK